ncbi:ADP-ribose glycohydrolase ARH3 [Taenia crassiceps]|uniref:Alpha-1,3-glucosyltransferase n=1 Tax=Taenia crassiceps TaxID=6207 RepID=A0ABR4QTE8_9CEST
MRLNATGWKLLSTSPSPSDCLTYMLAALLYCAITLKLLKSGAKLSSFSVAVSMMSFPGIILVDHGHFQYNCVSLGLFVMSLVLFSKDFDVIGSVFFCLAILYKQMELYHALPIFFFLLSKCFSRSLVNGLKRVAILAATVCLSFLLVFLPFLTSLDGLKYVGLRMFPVDRGLFEDKVHEKSILLVAIPVLCILPIFPLSSYYFLFVSTLNSVGKQRVSLARFWPLGMTLLGYAVIFVMQFFVQPPGRRIVSMDRLIRGCLYGSVFGDVCGAPFELKAGISLNHILDFFSRWISKEGNGTLRYTDDTEMALCICDSLKRMNGFNAADMARTFRNYGGSIGSLFGRMKSMNFADPFKASSQQFCGSGSYGNGGAMRITPIPLYGLGLDTKSFNTLVCQVTALTHTNPLGLFGALLQAHAIRRILAVASAADGSTPCTVDATCLIDNLRGDLEAADLSAFAFGRPSNFHLSALQLYQEKLDVVKQFVMRESPPTISEVVRHLGNGEPAIEAIPTALYVFLQCLKPMPHIPYESLLIKCSIYAATIGNDTDTIGCMACAVAGALVGAERIESNFSTGDPQIPANIFGHVEGLETINEYCDWLIQRSKGCEHHN